MNATGAETDTAGSRFVDFAVLQGASISDAQRSRGIGLNLPVAKRRRNKIKNNDVNA
jgi:energy-coupling factor transporter transmembrane protein EcfT